MRNRRQRRFWMWNERRRQRDDRLKRLIGASVLCLAVLASIGVGLPPYVAMAEARPVPAVVTGTQPSMASSTLDARPGPGACAGETFPHPERHVRASSRADAVAAFAGVPHAHRTPCRARFVWPLAEASVIRGFDPPAQPWLPGHRGVDLAAGQDDVLKAPARGIIAFAGVVAGKSVVSIRHGALTSTFEPASTTMAVGDELAQGEPFATVQGQSDHCADSCVHWGVKRADGYLDPVAQTVDRRIMLKPVA